MKTHTLNEPKLLGTCFTRLPEFILLVFVLAAFTASRAVADPTYLWLIDDPNEATANSFAAIDNQGQILGNGPSRSQPGFLLSGSVYKTVHAPFAGATCTGMNDRGQIVGYYTGQNVPFSGHPHGFLLDHGVGVTLDDPNAVVRDGTSAAGINNKGQIVGWYGGAHGWHGFLLQGGAYTDIDDPNALGDTFATGINDRGQIVGYYEDANSITHGFLLDKGVYTTIDEPNALQSDPGGTQATGINNNGQIVGYYADAQGRHGFLLDQGVYTTIDDPNAAGVTIATSINNKGQIVGYYDGDNSTFGYWSLHGFLLQGGVYTDAPPDAKAHCSGQTTGINDRGQVVGSYFSLLTWNTLGFLLDHGLYTTLADPVGGRDNFGHTSITGINNRGQIIGWYSGFGARGSQLETPFLLEAGVYTGLTFPGGFRTVPGGINDRGQVVGVLYDTEGSYFTEGGHGFLAYPVQ